VAEQDVVPLLVLTAPLTPGRRDRTPTISKRG
jgi:hypothetical protein